MPACVEICPTGARKFGNVLDPKSEVSEILRTKRVFVLKEDAGTLPRFFYYFDERYPNTLDPEALAIAARLREEEGDAYGTLPGSSGPDQTFIAKAEPQWWNASSTRKGGLA
jgi:ferredoxin